MFSDATESPDGKYRFRLTRIWEQPHGLADVLPICMVNPSTAGKVENDNTIVKCIGFAQRWGYGGIDVVNLQPHRSTDPRLIEEAPEDVMRTNDDRIRHVLSLAAISQIPILVAWGNNGKAEWAKRFCDLTREVGVPMVCLGTTITGHPLHPLMVGYDRTRKRWLPWDQNGIAALDIRSFLRREIGAGQ
jgi:hypothetical protein